MSRKNASQRQRRRRVWSSPKSLVVGAIVVLAAAIGVRLFMGPGSATAQAPQTRGTRSTVPSAATQTPPAARRQVANPGAKRTVAKGFVGDTKRPNQNIAAVVNGQPITRKTLASECLRRYGKDVLESIVNKHLIMQECQLRGITITNQDVENEVDDMATKFGLSKDRWLSMLESERDIKRDQYRREIIWPTLALRRLASQSIVVTTEELRKVFESQYGRSVKVRVISVASKERANQLLQMAKARPDDFGDLAKKHSEDSNSAASRGLIPPIRRHVGNEEIERVAFSLKKGDVSPVIHAANQYLILKCEEQLPDTYIANQNLKLIEQQLHDQLRDEKLRSAADGIFKSLQKKAKVVNVFNNPTLRQQMPGVAATVNNRKIMLNQLSDECYLRHGKDVLEGEINRFVLQQELKSKNRSVTDQAIDAEIARAADAYGYLRKDNTPDVDAWLKSVTESDEVTVDLYVRDAVWPSVALKSLVSDRVQVTPEDLEKGFASNYGERVKVLVIVLGNQRQAHEVWKQAREANTDEAFGKLAHTHSIEPVSRANFGEVPPIRKFGGQKLIEAEAFSLKKGDLSQIIGAGDKHIIMRCLGRTKPDKLNRQAVEAELWKDIEEKKLRLEMAKEFDRLKETAQIDNFLAGTSQSGKRPTNRPAAPTTQPVKQTSFQLQQGGRPTQPPRAVQPRAVQPRAGQPRAVQR